MLKLARIFLLTPLLVACSNNVQRNAPPVQIDYDNTHTELIRFWGDEKIPTEKYLLTESARYSTFDKSLVVDEDGRLTPQHHLTISGGGANGAYGAGLLNGLTESGNRPEYRLVTGISTGAIIGLYAFLGEEYDYKIKNFYTQLSDGDLYESRYIWQLFSSPSLLNTSKFEQIVRNEIDKELINKVKQEYLRGRTFLVKTTNLDSQRSVIWNMGAIALLDDENAEHLFESVIIASASIPGIFEPVLIPVELDGVLYDELHVDGGVVAQVFFIPEEFDIEEYPQLEQQFLAEEGVTVSGEQENNIWIINNSRIGSEWKPVEEKVTDIMGRSIATMLTYQNRHNLTLIYQQSLETNSSFNLSFIDQMIPNAPEESPFNNDYMRRMYCYGYTQGLKPQHWHNQPPSMAEIVSTATANPSLNTDIRTFDWDKLQPGLADEVNRCLETMSSD